MVGRLLLVGALALSACGDDDDDIVAPDAAVADASGIDGGPLLPDLKATGITRGITYYKVQYCNMGTDGAEGNFRVRITNVGSSETFETPPVFSVPEPGACSETGGITCGLIGDPGCTLRGDVFGFVDSSNAVEELDEANNQIVIGF